MKRIAIAVTNDLTYDQRMIRTCEALLEGGYDVTLIGRELEYSSGLEAKSFKQIRLRCSINSGPLFYAEFNRKLARYLGSQHFDLAVACDLDTILAVMRSSRSKGRPFIFDAHELFTEVPELDDRPIIQSVWSRIGKMCIPAAAGCYTVGEAIAAKLTEKYGNVFRVVRNLPPQSKEPLPGWEEREAMILYQGALNEGRGLEVLIDSMMHIEGYTLMLAGEGDLSETLRRRVKESDLAGKVQFLGRIHPEKLPALTARARIGINVLESRSKSYYFSLANKFFDYMQAGTPSVNMDFPEYRAILNTHKTGIALTELSTKTLSGSILRLLEDRELWTSLSRNCFEARQVYSWENERTVLLDIYDKAISP